MLTDLQIAQYLVKQYAGETTAFDIFDPGTTDGICWSSIRIEGITYIFFRGSVTLQDWLRDATAIANPFSHDELGPCHPGFYIGMHELWIEIKSKTQGPWVICGHSLGAGRACILTGIMVLDGSAPLRRVCFGEPLPGFAKLASIIQLPTASYRNGDAIHHDPVTDVPLSFPPEEFVHPVPLTLVTAMPGPDANSKRGVFAWHSMTLYAEALGNAAA